MSSTGRSSPSPDLPVLLVGAAAHLSSDDIEALRASITRWVREIALRKTPSAGVDEQMRKSLRITCAKARLQRVRAEQLVVDLKQLWATIPSEPSARANEKMNWLVSACIDEYYVQAME